MDKINFLQAMADKGQSAGALDGFFYAIDSLGRIHQAETPLSPGFDPKTPGTEKYKLIGAVIDGQVRLAPQKEKKQRIRDKQHLSLYITPDELQIIAQAAAISGKTMSGWCREILTNAARTAIK